LAILVESLSLYIQGSRPAITHTLLAEVALKGRFIVGMGKDHPFRASVDAGHTGYALLAIDIVSPFLVLEDAIHGADLSAFPTLGASPHLESPWIGKMRDYG
jgi:hypothetical protein